MKPIVITGRTLARLGAGLAAGVLIVAMAACGSDTAHTNSAQTQGQKLTNDTYSRVIQNPNDQYPPITDSVELHNLRERLLRYNNPSKISYIYLLSQTGGVYAYYTVKGKVTANGSQMTTTQGITWTCDSKSGTVYCDHLVTDLPEDDLSFGPSEPGIFFFTTDDVMITTDAPYILSDAPLKINPATLTLEYPSGSKPSSTGK